MQTFYNQNPLSQKTILVLISRKLYLDFPLISHKLNILQKQTAHQFAITIVLTFFHRTKMSGTYSLINEKKLLTSPFHFFPPLNILVKIRIHLSYCIVGEVLIELYLDFPLISVYRNDGTRYCCQTQIIFLLDLHALMCTTQNFLSLSFSTSHSTKPHTIPL